MCGNLVDEALRIHAEPEATVLRPCSTMLTPTLKEDALAHSIRVAASDWTHPIDSQIHPDSVPRTGEEALPDELAQTQKFIRLDRTDRRGGCSILFSCWQLRAGQPLLAGSEAASRALSPGRGHPNLSPPPT